MPMSRTYGLRLAMKSVGLVAVGVLVAVLTENLWIGIGMALAGVAALAYAVRYRSRRGQL